MRSWSCPPTTGNSNHVPLQRYFPGVFSQYVPSLHKEESSRHSFLSEDRHDIHVVSLASFPWPRPRGRKRSTFSPPTRPGNEAMANEVRWWSHDSHMFMKPHMTITWSSQHDVHSPLQMPTSSFSYPLPHSTHITGPGPVQAFLQDLSQATMCVVWECGNVGRCVSNAH